MEPGQCVIFAGWVNAYIFAYMESDLYYCLKLLH